MATSGQPHYGPPLYPPPPASRQKTSVGKIIAIIAGGLIALVGVCALLGAIGLLWLDGRKGDDGYFTTSAETFTTPLNAITSDNLEIAEGGDASVLNAMFGKLRFHVRAADDQPVFIGIGRTGDVDAYLAGVGHERLQDFELDPFRASYLTEPGDVQPEKPGAQSFWQVSSEGPGERTLTWKVEEGSWSIVVMNADGSAPVDTRISVGASVPLIGTIAWICLLGGLVVALIGLALILGAILLPRRKAAAAATTTV